MRKMVVLLLVSMLCMASLGSPATAAGKKKRVERVETRQYVGFSGFRGAVEGTCDMEPAGCVIFPVEKGDRFVSIEIVDTAGLPVWASVYVYGYPNAHEHVCGSSDSPFAITPGLDTLVVVLTQTTGGATEACEGPTTVGNVTATFSNVR